MQKNKDFVKLPESELQIMKLIWEMDKNGATDIYAGALLANYPDEIGHLALTTIITLINRLHGKGFVDLEKHGRINNIIVLKDEEEYKHKAAADFVKTVYNNNLKGMISALYSDGILTKDDISELRSELEAEK